MEKLTIEQLIRKVADMKALYKNVEKKGNRLASEFCKTLEGGFFAATRDGGEDVTVQYIKVNGAKRKGEHIRLDVDGVEIGRYDNGSIGYVQRLNCLEYWGGVRFVSDYISRFKEISEEEFEGVFSAWSNYAATIKI